MVPPARPEPGINSSTIQTLFVPIVSDYWSSTLLIPFHVVHSLGVRWFVRYLNEVCVSTVRKKRTASLSLCAHAISFAYRRIYLPTFVDVYLLLQGGVSTIQQKFVIRIYIVRIFKFQKHSQIFLVLSIIHPTDSYLLISKL